MTVLERPLTTADTELLVMRAQRGDRRAFDALVEAHRARVQSYCVRLLGSEPEGEQAAQQAWTQAWTQLGGFGLKCPFEHWLMPIARHVCWNITRTKKGADVARGQRLDVAEEAGLPSTPGFEGAVIASVYAQQVLAMIRECAKASKPRWDALDLMIFHLRFEQGVETAREVARRLGRSENIVKYRLYKRINPVLETVRKRLEAEEKSLTHSDPACVLGNDGI